MFGGGSVRDIVGRIMREVITNQLARQYNMKGQKGKNKFTGLQLLTVLYSKSNMMFNARSFVAYLVRRL